MTYTMVNVKLGEPDTINQGYRWVNQDCPVCLIAPTRFIGKRGGESHRENLGVECDIWSCGDCGLIFPNPMPLPLDGLDQHYKVDADEYFQAHDKESKLVSARNIANKAEELLGRKGKLLDIGIGRGEIILAAKEIGWEVEGVEPSESFADYVEERTGAKIWRKPIEECDMAQQGFDVVILAGVLEHLYNPDEVIKNISIVLRPGGLLFLDVPNEKGLFFKFGNLYQRMRGRSWCVNLAPTFPPFHVFGFSKKSLIKLMKKI